MKSYLPLFDWNSGDEIIPWDWLYDEDCNNKHLKNRAIVVKIRKR